MEKFTKGKWMGKPTSDRKAIIISCNEETVCRVNTDTIAEGDANANLISCSPEMYDLLKRAQEFFGGYDSPLEREIKELFNKINS